MHLCTTSLVYKMGVLDTRSTLPMMAGSRSPKTVLEIPFENNENTCNCERGRKRMYCEPSTNLLNLRHCSVCDNTVECLASDTFPALSELWLGPVFENSQTVLSALSKLPGSVTHLDLDLRNALHLLPKAIPILCEKTHIKTLGLRLFGDNGAAEFAKWIHKNPNLERLDLRGNRIGSLGARAIIDALVSCNHGLKYLNLSCNCIMDGDMLEKVMSLKSLEVLDVSFNWIGDEEVKKISNGLAKNKSLRELNIFGCQRISDDSLHSLFECLRDCNKSLWKIQAPEWNTRASSLMNQIKILLKLNKAGRYLLQEQASVPLSLWPHALEKSNQQPENLYYFLRHGSMLNRF